MASASVCVYATRNNNETYDDHDDDEITLIVGDVTFFVPRSVLTAVDNFFDHIRSVGKTLPADTVTINREAIVFHVILRYLRAVRDGCVPEFLDTLTGLTIRQRAKVCTRGRLIRTPTPPRLCPQRLPDPGPGRGLGEQGR
jgi:hypothetical protein